ncbi:MAG: zinc ribbon domain-containing protein [bacterium]
MEEGLFLPIKLQELDSEIAKNEQGKKKLSHQIRRLEIQISELEKDLLSKQEELKEIKKKRRGEERRMDEVDLRLAKHEEEKYKVKSQDEFTALEKEVSRVESEKREIEDLLLELMEKEEELTQFLPSFKVKAEAEKNELDHEKRVLISNLKKLTSKGEKFQDEREKLVLRLNPVLLEQYERLRQLKHGLAVVPIKDGICEGCNVKVPPSLIGRVKRGKEIVYCENCNRILYNTSLRKV